MRGGTSGCRTPGWEAELEPPLPPGAPGSTCGRGRVTHEDQATIEWDRAKAFRANVDDHIDALMANGNIMGLDMAVVVLNTAVHRAQLLRNHYRAIEYGADSGRPIGASQR